MCYVLYESSQRSQKDFGIAFKIKTGDVAWVRGCQSGMTASVSSMHLWLLFTMSFMQLVTGNDQETGFGWHDLEVTTSRDGACILRSSSGFVPNGHVCGIIGPSGAGKSTLLAALGGVTPNHAGLSISGSVWWQDTNSTPTTLSMR